MSKPAVPKGTRDFLPSQSIKRKYIFDTIENVYRTFGYRPIETPSLELLSTLTGKYGEEGDRLVFKVLNNGDYLAKANKEALADLNSNKLTSSIAKRGLRYDLTVPFARFVAMHRNDIAFPFKRYQIQPVWRADRPQKGRYQEFYQCDADVVGSESLVYEAELIQIYDQVFDQLNLPVTIRVNNRKILAGIAEVAGVSDQMTTMTVCVDKLDKIGWDGVKRELTKAGFSESTGHKIESLFNLPFEELSTALSDSEIGLKGIEELNTTLNYLSSYTAKNQIILDPTLARGLNYYTGFIVEVNAHGIQMGSIGGGGRYDDLTSVFGLNDVSGVGISFGAARIYDVLEEKILFPDNLQLEVQILLIPMEDACIPQTFEWLTQLRAAGIDADMYPEAVKMKKSMKYADMRGIKTVGIIGSDEIESGAIVIKDMDTGEQKTMSIEKIVSSFKK